MTTQPPLGPLSTAEIFDTAFRLYRAHLQTFLRIAFSLYGPLILLKFILAIFFIVAPKLDNYLNWPLPLGIPYGFDFEANTTSALLTIILRVLEFLFLYPITIGVLCNAAAQAYLQQPPTLQKACKLDQPRFASLLSIGAMLIPISILILLSGQFLFGRTSIYLKIIHIKPVMLATFIGSIIIYARLILAPAIIVMEGYRPLASWDRSWRLGQGTVWQALQVVVLSNLLMAILVFSFGLSVRAGMHRLIPYAQAELLGFFVGHGLWVISLAFQAIIYTIFYYNLRVRKEGYDLALKLEQNASIYSAHWSINNRRLLMILIFLIITATITLSFLLFLSQTVVY